VNFWISFCGHASGKHGRQFRLLQTYTNVFCEAISAVIYISHMAFHVHKVTETEVSTLHVEQQPACRCIGQTSARMVSNASWRYVCTDILAFNLSIDYRSNLTSLYIHYLSVQTSLHTPDKQTNIYWSITIYKLSVNLTS